MMNLPFGLGREIAAERVRQALDQERNLIAASAAAGVAKVLRQFNHCLRKGDSQRAATAADRIRTLYTLAEEIGLLTDPLACVTRSAGEANDPCATVERHLTSVPTYWVSSMALRDCHRYLMQCKPGTEEEPEWMLAVTGLRVGRLFTLERWLEVKLSHQSSGRAAADMGAFTQLMLDLEEYGQALHAVFHSHRFAGPPTPSVTDLTLQETLELASYPAVQAIFSTDGYVRFFARARHFDVVVYGKGVQKNDRFLYRLCQIS